MVAAPSSWICARSRATWPRIRRHQGCIGGADIGFSGLIGSYGWLMLCCQQERSVSLADGRRVRLPALQTTYNTSSHPATQLQPTIPAQLQQPPKLADRSHLLPASAESLQPLANSNNQQYSNKGPRRAHLAQAGRIGHGAGAPCRRCRHGQRLRRNDSVAVERPRARLVATDTSAAALDVARRNAMRHGVQARITLIDADLLGDTALAPDISRSNPPYVPARDRGTLPPEVRDHGLPGPCSGAKTGSTSSGGWRQSPAGA